MKLFFQTLLFPQKTHFCSLNKKAQALQCQGFKRPSTVMLYPTASIVLHTRVNRDGLRPVYLRATYKGKSKHFALDLYCRELDWNDKERRYSKAADGAKESNDLLRSIEQRAADALYQFKRDGFPFTFERFEQMVFSSSAPVLSLNVSDYAEKYAARLDTEGRAGNAVFYRNVGRRVREFKPETVFSDINQDWLNKFERYLRTVRKNTDGGIYTVMGKLKSLCNIASDREKGPADWQPFKRYKIKKANHEGGGRARTLEDFRLIESAALVKGSDDDFYRDLFVLSFYLRGANMADIARLTEKSIVAGRVEFVRWKTRNTRPKLYSLPLLPEVAAIFDKYKRPNMRWLLPILDGLDGFDDKKAKSRVDGATKHVNKAIRRIAAALGLDTSNLKFYSARHTGATALGQAGVNPRIIQEYLGHEDFKTTQVYLKKHSPGEVDAAADVLRKV